MTKLNGFPVVRSELHANGISTVIVDRGQATPCGQFVVASWWPALGTTWSSGHYCAKRTPANVAFKERAARENKRSARAA